MQALHKNPFLSRSEQWWTITEIIQIDKMFSSEFNTFTVEVIQYYFS